MIEWLLMGLNGHLPKKSLQDDRILKTLGWKVHAIYMHDNSSSNLGA